MPDPEESIQLIWEAVPSFQPGSSWGDHAGLSTQRARVPGGYLYRIIQCDDAGQFLRVGGFTFVPDQG